MMAPFISMALVLIHALVRINFPSSYPTHSCAQSASVSQTTSVKITATVVTGQCGDADVTSQRGVFSDTGLIDLSALHNVPRIIKHIPKEARPACAFLG